MTRRLLPIEEWPRLADTPELGPVWTQIPPSARVLVVEDGPRIVATWVLLAVVHLEGAWIDPTHPAAAIALYRGMRAEAAALKATAVWTGAADPAVAQILERMGAQKVPCDSYVLSLTKGEQGPCLPQ